MRPFQLGILVLCFCNELRTTQAESEIEMLTSESNSVVQAQIKVTINAFLSGDSSELKTNWKGFRELDKLTRLAESKDEIVKQLAIFAVVERHEEDQQVLESLLVLHFLDLKPSIPIRVLAPYLDSRNEQLREFSRSWFNSHDIVAEGPSAFQAVNYVDYLKYVRGNVMRNQETPPAFIEFIYERSPDRALRVFFYAAGMGDTVARLIEMREEYDASRREFEKDGRGEELVARLAEWHKEMAAKQGKEPQPVPPVPPPPRVKQLPAEMPKHLESKPPKEILLSEHIISNVIWLKENRFDERLEMALPEAKQQLTKLAESDRWWARLYVAEIMRQHRDFRQAEILENLSHDENQLVSKAAKSALPAQ